jgi:photosystem II stability/assembly factor-like uncharacterized protein
VKKLPLLPAVMLMTSLIASAQNWTTTGAPTNAWQCIASSADGSRLIAGAWGGSVYLSTNSGGNWMPTLTNSEYWSSVASSADGCKLVAAAAYTSASTPGGFFTSTNSGVSWISNSLPLMYWGSVASSADGNTLVAVAPFGEVIGTSGAIFSSTNSGTTWTSNTLNNAVGVVTSADGKKMAVVAPLKFLRSTDSGTTWTPATNAPLVYSIGSPSQYIACSADGTKLVLCVPLDSGYHPGPIYVSTNSGDTWNLTLAPTNVWGFVTMSADGNTIVAVPNHANQNGAICLSTNGGTTWATNSAVENWGATAISADGGKLAAAAAADPNNDINSGPIYVSQSIRSPLMVITPASGGLKLSWLVPSTNFVLQLSPNLSTWKNITNDPALNLNNLRNEVTLPSTNAKGFYRLKTP